MFEINDNVKLNESSKEGKVISILEKNNYIILVNNKKIKVSGDKLKLCKSSNPKKETNTRINMEVKIYDREFLPEIMIRHQVLEEAIFNLEQFINEAKFNNIKSVKIIHGKNGGILRKAVHEFLKSNKYVESFRLGNYFEGSYGVTIATLKK